MLLHRWAAIAVMTVMGAAAFAQAPDLENMDIVLKAIPNGPVALVNGQTISADEYRDLYRGETARWQKMNPTLEITDEVRIGVALGVLRELIERSLLLQEAQKRKLSISDADLQQAWTEQMEAMRKGLAKQEGRAEGDLPTEADVLAATGGTKEAGMAELREALIIEQARAAIIKEKGVTVSDQEVAQWFEKYKDRTRRPDMMQLKQIFFKAPADAPPSKIKEAQRKADEALKRIQSGQSFEGVAKASSEGSARDQGGDWGMLPTNQLPPFILEAANKLKPNECSGVISSEYGFHIIKLIDLVPGKEFSLDEVKEDVHRMLLREKGADAVREFCNTATADDQSLTVFLDLEKQLVGREDLMQALQHMFRETPPAS